MKTEMKVPQGYFEQLDRRLCEIPAKSRTRDFLITPYLSLAASFVAIMVVGTLAIRKTLPAVQPVDQIGYEEFYYADLLPVTDPYFFMGEEEYVYDEAGDALNWAIETRVPAEYIEYVNE